MSNISTTLSRLGDLDTDRGELLWQRLINTVNQIGTSIVPISQNIALLNSRGKLTPEIAKAYLDWYRIASKMLNSLADLIEQEPSLRDAIDAAGTMNRPLEGLASILQGVERPSDDVVSLLRSLPAVTPQALNGLGSASDVAGNLARFAGPAWQKLMDILRNRGVITVGSTAVVANKVGEILGSDSDLEEQRAKLYATVYAGLIKSGIDPEDAHARALQIVNNAKTGVNAPLLWLGGGAIGLGLLLYWMKRQGVTVIVPERGGRS